MTIGLTSERVHGAGRGGGLYGMGQGGARRFTPAIIMAASLLLAACATTLYQQANELRPSGSAFQRALYQSYLELAASRFEQDRGADSDFYAGKAIQAGEGASVAPLEAKVPAGASEDVRGQVEDARRRLMAVLGAGAGDKMAVGAAKAQVGYDCWVHELGVSGAATQASQCKAMFLAQIAELEKGLMPPEAAVEPALFTVYFGFDEWFLTADALDVITTAIETARVGGHTRILSEGHTDTSGPAAYNQKLSVRRAEVVKTTMVEMGAIAGAIEVKGYGETQPAVETGDNVREPRNRRTEIKLIP